MEEKATDKGERGDAAEEERRPHVDGTTRRCPESVPGNDAVVPV